MKNLTLKLLTFYKKYISRYLPVACRFTPTCSVYTYEAVAKYGTITGLWLGAKRILKCQPFHPGGVDNVP